MNKTDTKPVPKPKELIGSLVHGLNIIRAFDRADPQMTMTQVAEKTGIPITGVSQLTDPPDDDPGSKKKT